MSRTVSIVAFIGKRFLSTAESKTSTNIANAVAQTAANATATAAAEAVPAVPWATRIRTMPRRAADVIKRYFVQLGKDYKTSIADLGNDMKKHPIKATGYAALCFFVYKLFKTNPDGNHFYRQVVHYSNELAMLGSSNRNAAANAHVRQLMDAFKHGEVRCHSFGFIAFIWLDKYPKDLNMYEAQCPYTAVGRIGALSRIVDVGLADRWFVLKYKMANFDVAEDEVEEFSQSQSFFDRLKSFI